jgi:hypothetical protein
MEPLHYYLDSPAPDIMGMCCQCRRYSQTSMPFSITYITPHPPHPSYAKTPQFYAYLCSTLVEDLDFIDMVYAAVPERIPRSFVSRILGNISEDRTLRYYFILALAAYWIMRPRVRSTVLLTTRYQRLSYNGLSNLPLANPRQISIYRNNGSIQPAEVSEAFDAQF